MKLAIFAPNINQGGTERVAVVLANEFARLGFEVCLFTLSNQKLPYECNVSTHSIDTGNKFLKIHRLYSRYSRLKELVAREQIDVLLSMGEYNNFVCSLMGSRILRIIRITNSLSTGRSLKSRLLKYITNLSCKFADVIVLPTETLAEELKLSLKHIEKLVVVPNPIILPDYQVPIDSQKNVKKRYWLHVGQFVHQKNQSSLLRIYSKYRAMSDEPKNLLLLGKGELEQQLRLEARQLGLGETVEFHGWSDQPFELMRGAEALLLTSLWEGFPNVMLEAMSQATTVISYDCKTGPREILLSGQCGFLVKAGDEVRFAEQMVEIEKDESLKSKMRQSALARSEDFAVENIVKSYLDIFDTLRNNAFANKI